MNKKKDIIREGIPESELFGKLVAMLHVAMADQMGMVENPVTGKRREPNIQMAGETLAMLELLRKRMNLEPDEVMVLDNVLNDLRMRYTALVDKMLYEDNKE
ncbi:MAG: DUF1844 domain-containing protein [Candidatus Zixiibacteriota bacterium]